MTTIIWLGTEWRLHSCLSGEQFWMPKISWPEHWARDFWDLQDAIDSALGVAYDSPPQAILDTATHH